MYARLLTGLIDAGRFTAAGPTDHYVHLLEQVEVLLPGGVRGGRPAEAAQHGGVVERAASATSVTRQTLLDDARNVAAAEGLLLVAPVALIVHAVPPARPGGVPVAAPVVRPAIEPGAPAPSATTNRASHVWVVADLDSLTFGKIVE